MSLFFAAMLLVSSLGCLAAQSTGFTFHKLGQEEGLHPADKYFFAQDAKGFIWIGTAEGLQRFDGLQLETFCDTTVSARIDRKVSSRCFEDRHGTLWYTTAGAVRSYNPVSGRYGAVPLPEMANDAHAFYLDSTRQILWLRLRVDKGAALYHYYLDKQAFAYIMPLPGDQIQVTRHGGHIHMVVTALKDEQGAFWYNMDSEQHRHILFNTTNDGNKYRSGPGKRCYIDEDGQAWVGVFGGIAHYRLGADTACIILPQSAGFQQSPGWVHEIVALDQGRLLAASDNGLWLFDKKTFRFVQHIAQQEGGQFALPFDECHTLYHDPSGHIWVGGNDKVLAYAHSQKIKFPFHQALQGQRVTAMAVAPDGHIWCSTKSAGIFVLSEDFEVVQHIETLNNVAQQKQGFPLPAFEFFHAQGDEWWASVGNTFVRWDGKAAQFIFKAPYFLGVNSTNADRVNYSYTLRNGQALVAKGPDVYELHLHPEKVELLPWHNLEQWRLQNINIIFQDRQGRIYLGDDNERLLILTLHANGLHVAADFQHIGSVFSICEDEPRNKIWLATSNGLQAIQFNSKEGATLFSNPKGLPAVVVYDVLLALDGALWLPGNNGLRRYYPEEGTFQMYNTADGLVSNIFYPRLSMAVQRQSFFCLAGTSGLNVFNPQSIAQSKTPVPVAIRQIIIDDVTPYPVADISFRRGLELPFSKNTLTFYFAALDYSDPKANLYRYQMIGVDEQPVEAGHTSFARYANLAPGYYTFKVWGSNSNGLFNPVPQELAVRIIPPFYRTAWFYLLCLLVLSGMVYGFFQYRLTQALKMERLRVKISSDLHDDVGTLLSGLAMQSEVLSLTAGEKEKPRLERITEISRQAMSRMRDTVWAIDARKDKLENLIDRMHEHAQETLSPRNIGYFISTEGIDPNSQLSVDVRQNLYLIFKEAITNVAKHSNGNEVKVKLYKRGKELMLHIQDNGKVSAKSHADAGLGLSNINMRAAQIGAKLTIRTDAGFEIELCKVY